MSTFSKKSSNVSSGPYFVGKLRLSQVITTFGPGAVVDLPRESVMVGGIDKWPLGQSIHDPRLEHVLNVTCFRFPKALSKEGGDLPCVRFPKNLICSNCGLFTWKKKCPECQSLAYPARLILICPAGHVDEFPWSWWVHRKGACTGQARLRMITREKTAALSDLLIRCDTCKNSSTLSGALGPDALSNKPCSGKSPWLDEDSSEPCSQKVRSVLRGASNVYFASTFSALSIPPWSDSIQILLSDHWQTLSQIKDEAIRRMVIPTIEDFKGHNVEDVLKAIQKREGNTTTITNLREEEYQALRNPGRGTDSNDFQVRSEQVPEYFQLTISQVVLASRLREICVLQGFTRIDPPDADNANQPLASLAPTQQNWLPAVEHRGEGIFIELNQDRVESWESRQVVKKRVEKLSLAYDSWRIQRDLSPSVPVPPRLILLHTLAHLLIRQLSLECGYSSSSLRERIYAGKNMCGVLIYTATADSDGSLGGLVQQGQKNRFDVTMQALLESAQWCSVDPLCMEHDPTHTGKLTMAACHACSLIAETSCERANRFLDRALVCDLPGSPVSGTGYFDFA